ncbi:bifunctional 2-C-methyl-D-erythritol 4-phosphate cytidylyltransferase/2-C-methyl-D-erythritol 2,4-cyclodiphosphate synthase [soil metagenome]
MHVTAIIAAGGSGTRLGAEVAKQFLDLDGRPLLEHSVRAFAGHPRISELIVALPAGAVAAPPAWLSASPKVRIVAGGALRQDSVANAFESITESDVVLIHDAARPFVSADLISRSIDAALAFGAAIAALPASDTVKQVTITGDEAIIHGTIPRDSIYLAQTPQAFRREILAQAVALGRSGIDATDEAALAEQTGQAVHVVEGDAENVKITTAADLARARTRSTAAGTSRAGTGYDLHRLVDGRRLIIGGVDIPFEKGALGHSDADVACHAATDAVLGAACLGDIGRHFPDSDPRWKGASSIELLRQAAALVRAAAHEIVNVDVVVVLERPKIAPYLPAIREGLAGALGIPMERVSVKGKTNEGVDAIGRGEAIAAHAVALIRTP